MLAYKGKQLVNILSFTKSGAVKQYEPVDRPGYRIMPLIENGKNIEEFKVIENYQISMF
ncbi:MAG: hypothetical protein E6344_18210 [Clostridium sp.]|nr:hypothetical protein [Clostridium sp.]MDU7085632.1 hypothetical protein [Clostridium sp.]